ncbi:DUF3107 domain-containing protein [Phytomonospora endophytica]|uniref:ATP-binding protein n=1 Tax=Phytomonospora endophytica TaxID=714109 RepID=A0A841FDQ4_9ACTN|nr:DUF3107 domain-containing protein [Phytomonospora endophytica]MBB6033143.1 hypothetical protein [Phytomonospora endophytica]GIG65369.1 ATP-binding protein [Phytomonospora endophytica]
MEVKIGVQYAPRELVLDSDQSADEVAKAVSQALSEDNGVLSLTDKSGKQVFVAVGKIAYVEISEQTQRPVGFTVS